MNIITKHTRLESITENTAINEILDIKIEEIKNKNLPIEQGLADYIAFGIGNIDNEINHLDNLEKQIKSEKLELKNKKILLSEKIAEYLKNMGLDKIKGSIVSSITITPEKESITKKFIYLVDKEELIKQGLGKWEENKTIKSSQIKINKKRG